MQILVKFHEAKKQKFLLSKFIVKSRNDQSIPVQPMVIGVLVGNLHLAYSAKKDASIVNYKMR